MRIVEQFNISPTLIRLCQTLFMQQLKICDPLYPLIVFTNLVAFHLSVIQVKTRTAIGNSISVQAEQKSPKFCCWNARKHWVDVNCIREMGLVKKCTFSSANGDS